MIQKAVLAGFVAAFTLLFAVNLAVHRGEAHFIMGWIKARTGEYERAAQLYGYGLGEAKENPALRDRLTVARGAALTASGEYAKGADALVPETGALKDEAAARLEALRLYDLGNARALGALAFTGEIRKLHLMSALNAYTGAYQITRDEDAAFNYVLVEKLLESEKKPTEQGGADNAKNPDESASEDEKGKQEDAEDRDASENETPKEKENGGSEPKNEGEPKGGEAPKGGNWSNAGNTQPLQSDPGGTRGSNGSVPLSELERKELADELRKLSELQKEGGLFLRPDGKIDSQGSIPNSLRDLFSGDPFFQQMVPDSDRGPNGKSW